MAVCPRKQKKSHLPGGRGGGGPPPNTLGPSRRRSPHCQYNDMEVLSALGAAQGAGDVLPRESRDSRESGSFQCPFPALLFEAVTLPNGLLEFFVCQRSVPVPALSSPHCLARKKRGQWGERLGSRGAVDDRLSPVSMVREAKPAPCPHWGGRRAGAGVPPPPPAAGGHLIGRRHGGVGGPSN